MSIPQLLAIACLVILSGCSGIEPVPAWERGYLADEGIYACSGEMSDF